ncbi:MAG TPA: tetratricopeptide repeat protein [Crenotrichaceae bacterium]|nr:tetratricopeptide repeat protein [Crenotrichaceae bacterium]
MAEEFETEEQRVEALMKWWKDNRKSVITGLIAGIAIVVGWNSWKAYQREQALQASDIYQELLVVSLDDSKKESVETLSKQLMNDYDSTAYSAFAALFLAKAQADAGDFETAMSTLQGALSKAPFEGFDNLVRLRMLRILLAQNNAEQAMQVLANINPATAGQFEAQFEQIKGDALLQLKRPNEARTAYQHAKEMGLQSGFLRLKLDDLAEPAVSLDTAN